MIPSLLQSVRSDPLEREYEGWIVEGIERYFRRAGRFALVWAVSPLAESSWPADEYLHVEGKLIGLQMKRPHISPLSGRPIDYSRLGWRLNNPPGQYGLVQAFPELFYCLPTFVNRRYRREALHHCIFWRPDDHSTEASTWYGNDNAKGLHGHISIHPNAYRWGQFLEAIQICKIGRKVLSSADIDSYIDKVIAGYRFTGAPNEAEAGPLGQDRNRLTQGVDPSDDSTDLARSAPPTYMVYVENR